MNIHILLPALVISSTLSSGGANIVLNGDFETGDLTNWVAPGFSGVEQSRGQIASAFDGTNFAIGTTNEPFTISQQLITEAGTVYQLDFYLARPQTANPNFAFEVDVFDGTNSTGDGDLLSEDLGNDSVMTGGTWVPFTYQFTAASTETTIRFGDSAIGTFSVDPAIDGITVDVVPEPSSLSFLGLSLLVLSRRRRN